MIVIRKFGQGNDFEQLVQLRKDIEVFDQIGADTSESSLQAQFKWTGHERWVLTNSKNDSLIGHAWAFNQSENRTIFQVFIHPDFRRKGWGTKLLDEVVNQVKKSGVSQIVTGAVAANLAGVSFLDATDFKPVGNNRFFEASAKVEIGEPVWPNHFTVKNCTELGDLSHFVAASNDCYADMWGHRENTQPQSLEHIAELKKRFPEIYNPAGIFIVFDGENEIAGLCLNRLDGDAKRKVIDSPGVVPRYRQLGLQRPLVQHSMHWLNQQKAAGDFHLHTWGDFDEAVENYHDLGFILEAKNHMVEYLFVE